MLDWGPFTLVDCSEPARWLLTALERPWSRQPDANYVAAVVPRGFGAYARLFHPAYLDTKPISWSLVAELSGRFSHALMQWHSISVFPANHPLFSRLQPPLLGQLPQGEAQRLVSILKKHTKTPAHCYFALWDGWGISALEHIAKGAVHFQLADRGYYLLQGSLESIGANPHVSWLANLWWPEDRAWCVATEVDQMCTYIGGTTGCIQEILDDPQLEVWPAALDQRVDYGSDQINHSEG